MAVGTPIAGTASGANGAALTVAFPVGMGIVADDIVVMFAVFYANSGTVPTDIDFTSGLTGNPSGWTWAKTVVPIKDSGGTQKGVAGWAWARATNSFSGSCGTISGGGTAGANSGSLMQSVKLPGCVTSGDPYEDAQSNNPNYTATVDWPAASMNRSTTGRSLIALLNSDNVNIGTPGSWTVLVSNASTQGLDSGLDIDHRAPGATGTYDPANGSMGANNNLGWATFHVMFTDTAGGAPIAVDLTAAVETDAAQVLTFVKTIFKTLTAATSTESARALSITHPIQKTITPATSSEVARPLSITHPIRKTLTAATETGVAQALTLTKTIFKTLTPAVESNAAVALTYSQAGAVSLTPALETDTAISLTFMKTIFKTVTPTVETDAAVALTYSQAGAVDLTPALEVDVAAQLSITKTIFKTLGIATETDTAQTLVISGTLVFVTGFFDEPTLTDAVGNGSPAGAFFGPASPAGAVDDGSPNGSFFDQPAPEYA